ncbi:MAG: hypothetical protein IKE92_12055, partial [Clostridiales bacterium]|nr:hypothetical protein [Clostridiales bacterium]
FFICLILEAILAWISRSSACSSSALLYKGSTRKFTARLKNIIDSPSFPIALLAIVKITSNRSSKGEIISVYSAESKDIGL